MKDVINESTSRVTSTIIRKVIFIDRLRYSRDKL